MDWTRLDELEEHMSTLVKKFQDIKSRLQELEVRIARAEIAAYDDSVAIRNSVSKKQSPLKNG